MLSLSLHVWLFWVILTLLNSLANIINRTKLVNNLLYFFNGQIFGYFLLFHLFVICEV